MAAEITSGRWAERPKLEKTLGIAIYTMEDGIRPSIRKGRNKRTVWEIPLSKFREAHFAVYPEKLVETCILASTREQDFVLDPFTGSGTTGVVASKLSRKFVGVELVSEYQEMAQKRIDDARSQLGLFQLSSDSLLLNVEE